MPSTRYAEIAPRVKAICEEYGLPYNTGPFLQQLGMVQRTILRLAFPGGKPRPKPGPFRGDDATASLQEALPDHSPAEDGEDGSGPEQSDEGVRVAMPDRS
jgi:linoleoyl-CoA desaturase